MSTAPYYTVAEVNRQLPRLQRLFVGILQVRGQLRLIYERLDDAGFAPGEDDADEVPADAPADVARDRARFFGMVETLREQVDAVQQFGCVIRDLDAGLVDWRARSGDHDVWLCWKVGEPEVRFFHDDHAGFDGRRPVSELEAPAGR